MKTRYILFAFAALAMSACARNVEPAEPEGVQVTVTATLEENDLTRTTVQDGGTQVFWEVSDEIKVFFKGTGSRFMSQNTEPAVAADFSGTLNILVGVNEGASSSNLLWGLYPYRADAVSDGQSVTTTLPAEQTGRAGSFAKNTHITLACAGGHDLAFYNVCGGVRFSLTQEGVKEVVFQGQNDEDIAGKVKLAFVDGVPAVQEIIEGQKSITLTAPGGGTFQTGQWYYIVALPGSLSNGFNMTFNTDTQYATLKSSGAKTIKRGIFGSLADADEDLIYKDKEGGDEPNPEDVIQFADPIAKYACVEKFDENNDGEVSYAEAAAATSLSGLFTDWNTVTSFDEIQYFTGVTSTSGVFTGLTQLTHITIPDNITTLGTFQGCTSLETVVLPEALTELPASCFAGCSSLTSVPLPAGITGIPNYCFYGCASLESQELPSTVVSIGQYGFSGCSALAWLELPAGFETIGFRALQNCTALTSIDFPTSLKTIGKEAFSGCTALASATIGTGVSIGQSAFNGCSFLVSVVLPDDMTEVPDGCFYNCTALSSITWPQALTSIGNSAFASCRFKEADYSLEIPSTVTTIGENAFGYVHHIVIPSMSPVSIASDSFKTDYTFLYVPANMVEMYKLRTKWSKYANRIYPIGDYPIEFTVGGTVSEAVDLGLSVKWASWNVGASAPEEHGTFFAWGETDVKEVYIWNNYMWCNGTSTTLTKYNANSSYGTVDDKVILDLDDDAAHVNWGGAWRMPTQPEAQELIDNCKHVWTTENGVNGCRFTSKKEGYTDKSIFIPAAGYQDGRPLYGTGSYGYYWCSSFPTFYPTYAKSLFVRSNNVFVRDDYYRCYGFPIRPVCE